MPRKKKVDGDVNQESLKDSNETTPNSDIYSMPKDEFNNFLVSICDTPFWHALNRFAQERNYELISLLGYIDSYKNPHDMSKTQGKREGEFDFINHVNELVKRKNMTPEDISALEEAEAKSMGNYTKY